MKHPLYVRSRTVFVSLSPIARSIESKTQWKETPLHFAARNNKLGTVKALISAGASTTSETFGGDTALQLATKYKFDKVVDYLENGSKKAE